MERSTGTAKPSNQPKSAAKPRARKLATAPASRAAKRRVADLGWTREQARRVREQLASFQEDWNAPGMDAYDDV